MKQATSKMMWAAVLALTFGSRAMAAGKPLKVYILAGQSSRAKPITPEEDAFWQPAASHQGYHYSGSAKTMALIGETFAAAMLQMEKK